MKSDGGPIVWTGSETGDTDFEGPFKHSQFWAFERRATT